MAKQQTNDLPDNTVEITTTVSYKGESLQSSVRIDSNDIANKILSEGLESTNKSIANLLQALYTKTSDNFKAVVNK